MSNVNDSLIDLLKELRQIIAAEGHKLRFGLLAQIDESIQSLNTSAERVQELADIERLYPSEISDAADKLYGQLRYELMRWANINPDDMEKYTALAAFSYIHKNSWRHAAERFIHDALHCLELYRGKANKPVSVSLEQTARGYYAHLMGRDDWWEKITIQEREHFKGVCEAVLDAAGVKYAD